MAKVKYTEQAWKDMQDLIADYDSEIGWHGVVEETEDGDYLVTDILVYPQYVTGATVEMDNEGYQKWLWDNRYDKRFYNIKLQGHSHVNMPVFPSYTDQDHQRKVYAEMREGDYYIFTIWNKKGDHKAWIYKK